MAVSDEQLTVAPEPLRYVALPVDRKVLNEARRIVSGSDLKLRELAEAVTHDPIFVVETLHAANLNNEAGQSPNIVSIQSALFRLGVRGVQELLDMLATRELPAEYLVQEELQNLKNSARRVAGCAEIIAAYTNPDLLETARLVSLLGVIGHLLACMRYREKYTILAKDASRPSLIYRLGQDLKFDVKAALLTYLRTHLVPQDLYFVFDREFSCKSPKQAALRFVYDAAIELVEAREHGKFERYSPRNELPGKSAFRLLRMSERQHAKIFEDSSRFLSEPLAVLGSGSRIKSVELATPPAIEIEVPPVGPVPASPALTTEEPFPNIQYLEAGEDTPAELPKHFSENSQRFFGQLSALFESQLTADELLSQLLAELVTDGPFERAALLVLQSSRKFAVIHTVAGEALPKGGMISVTDPISPLAMANTKVSSFNAKEVLDLTAPFGVTAYALSPIRTNSPLPVVLYVDCGETRSLPFEGRRIFRLVVGLLNNALSPGAISNDMAQRAAEQ